MLKRFFISVLGTMTGLWLSVAVLFFCGMIMIGYSIGKAGDSAVKVEKRSVLYFNLAGEISERATSQPFLQLIQNIDSESMTLEDMLRSLRRAADDDRIEGLYIKCDGSAMGTASREELVQAIDTFKTSGKWVVAYGDTYTQGDYLIASTADELYLNPVGAIDIHGVGGMTPFFKGLLDKVGVKMQIIKVGTFKSAVEPYVLTSMSEPARLQMQQYCDSLWSYIAGTIADNSGMPADSVRILAPQMIGTRQASFFVEAGLADELLYEREVDNHLRDLTDLSADDDLRLVTPADYLAANSSSLAFSTEKKHIAVYYAAGDIVDSGSEGIVGMTVVDDIVSLADDKNVAGLVFRVNSPGGSAFASEQIWEALQYFKSKHKPLYVSMGDYAASGGYYISCGADSIFADRTTLTGSIGVFGMIPDLSGLVTDKLGVNFSVVETNPNANGINLTKAMTPEQHAAMQKSVENIYELFTSRVAEGRHMPQDSVKAIAEGRVWTGGRAIELGLVDRLGSLRETVVAMADRLGMKTSETVAYPVIDENVWEKILRESGGLEMEAPLDKETLEYLYFVKRLREMNPMQARMEELVIE